MWRGLGEGGICARKPLDDGAPMRLRVLLTTRMIPEECSNEWRRLEERRQSRLLRDVLRERGLHRECARVVRGPPRRSCRLIVQMWPGSCAAMTGGPPCRCRLPQRDAAGSTRLGIEGRRQRWCNRGAAPKPDKRSCINGCAARSVDDVERSISFAADNGRGHGRADAAVGSASNQESSTPASAATGAQTPATISVMYVRASRLALEIVRLALDVVRTTPCRRPPLPEIPIR